MIKIRNSESDMLVYSDYDIYKEVIGKLLRIEKAENNNRYYLYTKNAFPIKKPEAINIHKRRIKYVLFDENINILHYYNSPGMNMRTCINSFVKDKDDVLHYTTDNEFAKMLLLIGNII